MNPKPSRELSRTSRRRPHNPRANASMRRHSTHKKAAALAVAGALLFTASVTVAGAALTISSSSSPKVSTALLTNQSVVGERAAALPLKLGSTGKLVARLERRLRALGFDIEVDRDFDEKTYRAVRTFQRDKGLEADGVVGTETWAALFSQQSSSGPVASQGNAGSRVTPAVSSGAQTQIDFAVRRASSSELKKHSVDGALGKPKANEALVAIELRTPPNRAGNVADNGSEASAGPAAGSTNGSEASAGSAAGSTNALSGNRGALTRSNSGNNSTSTTGSSGTRTSNGSNNQQSPDPTGKAPPPPALGTCGATLRDPLRGAGSISSRFGVPRGDHYHSGLDIAAPGGTPVYAAACGVISYISSGCVVGNSSCGGGYGNYVVIRHSGGRTTLYAHLSRDVVSLGDSVTTGQLIGYVGTTGSSTGNHLHFETRINGQAVNPQLYVRGGQQSFLGATGGPIESEPQRVSALSSAEAASDTEERSSVGAAEADSQRSALPAEESASPVAGTKAPASADADGSTPATGAGASTLAETPLGLDGTGQDDDFLEEDGPMPQNQSREGGEPAPAGGEKGQDDLTPRDDQGLSAESGENEGQDSAGGDLPPPPPDGPDAAKPGLGPPPTPDALKPGLDAPPPTPDAVNPVGGPPQSFPGVPLSGLPGEGNGCGLASALPLDPACSVPSP